MGRLALFGALVAVVGCGGTDEPTAPSVGTAPGTYALFSVSGAALPWKDTYYAVDALNDTTTFVDSYTSGSMVLNAAAEFTLTMKGSATVNDTGPKAFTAGLKGTYQLFGTGKIRLIGTKLFFGGDEFDTDPDTTVADISGTEITLVDADTTGGVVESQVYLFKRQ